MARILVIEDTTTCSLLKEILAATGHEVIEEPPKGLQSNQPLQEQPVDLVLIGRIPPKAQNLLAELKKTAPDLKIIVLCGEQETESFLEMAQQFEAALVFKPFQEKILLQAVEEALAGGRARQPNGEKILLINENPQQFSIPSNIFSAISAMTLVVQQPEEALQAAQAHDFSLVLFVASAQKTNDLEWVQALLQLEKACPPFLFFLAERAEPAYLAEIYKAGAIDVLIAPFQAEPFLVKINIFIELYQQKVRMVNQTQQLEDTLQTQYTISDNLIKTAKELKQSKRQLEKVYSELEQVTGVFQLFVPKPFLKRLTQNSFQAGHFEPENLSILFGDIRDYTQYAEQTTPSENFEFLNKFFNLMEPPIAQNGGFIDKFMGDGIMALFDHEKSADHAVQAAIQMQHALKSFGQQRKAEGLPEVKMGIGINTGEVMVGTLGSANRLNSTVIGDAVNLSARLEELTKKFEAKILISESTHVLLKKDHYHIREIDTVKIRGRSQPVIVYEVFDSDEPELLEAKLKTNAILSQGIALYKAQKFTEALRVFEACLDLHKDLLFFEYVKRCNYFHMFPPKDDGWDGSVTEKDLLISHKMRRRMTRYMTNIHASVLLNNAYFGHVDGIAVDASSNGMQLKVTEKFVDGIKLDMAQQFRIGAIFFVEIFLPFNAQQPKNPTKFKLLSQVKWAHASSQGSLTCWHIGLETLELPSHSTASLHKVLAQYQPEE